MSRHVRVGILVFAGLALFLVALFAIASRSFLFSNTFPLSAEFENVAGLQAGAPVQYQGANAGRVERVAFPDEPGGRFSVEMAIKNDVQPLINERTIAQIQSQSLVGGVMMVVLANPSLSGRSLADGLEPVEPGGEISSQEPFNISETSDQLLGTVDTFATVAVELQQIMEDVQSGEGSLGRFIYDDALYDRSVATIEQAEATAAETQRLMSDLSATTETVTADVQEMLSKVNRGEGTIGRLLNDDDAYQRILSMTDTLLATTARVEDVLANAESATQWATLGAYRFSENMEALKHNFLFKSYFEERGYMEKADFEVRESAIEATYEDLEAWQRELSEREARLDELRSRLEALQGEDAAPPASSSNRPAGGTPSPAGPPGSSSEAGEEPSSRPEASSQGERSSASGGSNAPTGPRASGSSSSEPASTGESASSEDTPSGSASASLRSRIPSRLAPLPPRGPEQTGNQAGSQ